MPTFKNIVYKADKHIKLNSISIVAMMVMIMMNTKMINVMIIMINDDIDDNDDNITTTIMAAMVLVWIRALYSTCEGRLLHPWNGWVILFYIVWYMDYS